MIDLPTLLIATAGADLLLGAALWASAGGRRDGLVHWVGALGVRACALVFLAVSLPADPAVIVVALGLAAFSMTLQGGALLAFGGRRLSAWIHTAVVAAFCVPFVLLAGDPPVRVLYAGLFLGTILAVLAGVSHQLLQRFSIAPRVLVTGGFAVGAVLLVLRAVAALFSHDPVAGFQSPDFLQSASMAAGFAALLASSLGFLLARQERATISSQRLATLDPLTGAYNRHAFFPLAERELSIARRSGQPLSLVMIDIDHFAGVNERHGQLVGDGAIRAVADVIRAQLRQEDMLARYGGEEFCVLLPQSPGPGAIIVAGRIREAIALMPLTVEDREIPVTVSVGVAARLDEGPESLDDLLGRANQALDLAKQRGRNRVVALSLGRSIAA